MAKTQILTIKDSQMKIERMAFQIWEQNYDVNELIFIGIRKRGTELANFLKRELKAICKLKIEVRTVEIYKANPLLEDIEFAKEAPELNQKNVIIVDDVGNTGRTLLYAVKPLLNHLPNAIQIAVLVDRQHKLFPVQPNFIGLSMSTSIQEHITVEFSKDGIEAYIE